jgi:hypothetical protein
VYSHFRPCVFIEYGKIPSLDIVPAHDAHNSGIIAQSLPGLRNMERMPQMEWVIFGNNTDSFHLSPIAHCKIMY